MLSERSIKRERFRTISINWVCQYPQLASNLVKTFTLGNLDKISSVVGRWWWWRLVALFRSEGFIQILNLPFGFSTITIELTHSEDSEIGTFQLCLVVSSYQVHIWTYLLMLLAQVEVHEWLVRHRIWVEFYIHVLVILCLQNNWHTHYKNQFSSLTLIFDKHFKRFNSSLVLSPIIKGELLSITINCTEWILCLVEMFKMQLPIMGIRQPL